MDLHEVALDVATTRDAAVLSNLLELYVHDLLTMNLTIWLEVATAVLLLVTVSGLMLRRFREVPVE